MTGTNLLQASYTYHDCAVSSASVICIGGIQSTNSAGMHFEVNQLLYMLNHDKCIHFYFNKYCDTLVKMGHESEKSGQV